MKTKDMNLITWILVSIILFGIILLLNSKAFGQEWTTKQKEVWKSVEANWEAIKNGDVESALELKHADVFIWSKPYPHIILITDIRGVTKFLRNFFSIKFRIVNKFFLKIMVKIMMEKPLKLCLPNS